MFSSSRRCTGSSSTMRIRSVMTHSPAARHVPNWGNLAASRLTGVLKSQAEQSRLIRASPAARYAGAPSTDLDGRVGETRSYPDQRPKPACPPPSKRATAKPAPQDKPPPKPAAKRPRHAAGMEPRRPLSRDRRPGGQARPRSRRGRVHRVRGGYKGKLADARGRAGCRRGARRGGQGATRRSRNCSAGSSPMPGWSMPATPPIPRAPSSTATCRSGSPRPRCICCSSRSNSTGSTTPCSKPAMADPALGHYRPWIEDIRKDKPYQLEDRVEQLFHEKSVTGRGLEPAVRRDHGAPALQGRRQDAGARADAQPAAGRRRKKPQGGRRGAGRDLQGRTCASSR